LQKIWIDKGIGELEFSSISNRRCGHGCRNDGIQNAPRGSDGIFYVRVWLNEGQLELGDDIMYVLIGGDIRPHVVDALQFLVEKIKSECVTEIEQK